jgi:hypothetical protein
MDIGWKCHRSRILAEKVYRSGTKSEQAPKLKILNHKNKSYYKNCLRNRLHIRTQLPFLENVGLIDKIWIAEVLVLYRWG